MAEKVVKKRTSKVNREKYRKLKEKAKSKKARAEKNNEDKVRLFAKGKHFDFGLLTIVLVLLTVGLIMLLSASAPYSLRTEGDSYFYFMKQLKFVIAGLVIMLIVSKIDYRIFNSKIAWLVYLGGLRIYDLGIGASELVLKEMMQKDGLDLLVYNFNHQK